MKIECFFKILLFIISLEQASAENILTDQKYLSDIPEPTEENLRWLMTADKWLSAESYLAKGKYLSLASKYMDPKTGLEEHFNWHAFETKNFDKEWRYDFSTLEIKLAEGGICDNKLRRGSSSEVNNYLECSFLSCDLKRLNAYHVYEVKPKVSEYWYKLDSKRSYLGKCPLNVQFFIGDLGSKNILHFRYKDVNLNKFFAEIDINGKSHFLNLDKCKRNKDLCEIVNIQFSAYEKDWIKLKKHQEKKDIPELNDLIQHLLPCVKKRDAKCVRSFFVSKSDYKMPEKEGLHPGHESFPYYYHFSLELNEEMYKELEACLKYENLLPHLYGTRGINKVCVFNKHLDLFQGPPKGDSKLISVTFPEGVRESWTREIHRKVEAK